MSLIQTTRRSGIKLIVLGVIGAAFFWATDPRLGPAVKPGPVYHPGSWLAALRGGAENPVDAATDGMTATLVGLAGCLTVLGIGVYLMSRRKV